MNRNISVTTYFEEHAPKSGQSEEVCERAVDALLKNGVDSMRELAEKDAMWVFFLFLGEKEELDEECHDLVRDMRHKYLVSVQKYDFRVAGKHGIEAYFRENAPEPEHLTLRAINALRRAGIETMDELYAASLEELKRVREMGVKSRAVALRLREQYARECGVPVKEHREQEGSQTSQGKK